MRQEEFEAWIQAPDTVQILKHLRKVRQACQDRMVEVAAGTTTVDEQALVTSRLAGRIMGLNDLIEIEWEDINA